MFQTITLLGRKIELYGLFNNLAIVAELLFLLLTIKDFKNKSTLSVLAERHFNTKKKKNLLHIYGYSFVEEALFFIIATVIISSCTPLVSKIFLGKDSANFFSIIFILPPLGILVGILSKNSPLNLIDISMSAMSLALIFYKIACFCAGCCYGIEYATPFFNYRNERYEIPVQLIEMACAIIMFIILLIMRKHKKKDGLICSTFMLMYCGSRFCSEFLRDDYPQIIGRMTAYHVQCIIGFVLGLIYLIIVLKFGERITNYFETKNQAFIDKKLKSYKSKTTAARKMK